MVNRILVVKKGIGVADRAVKFVAGYIKFLNVKSTSCRFTSVPVNPICSSAVQRETKEEDATDNDFDDDDETTATRFTHRLLKHFLKGFQAKDKNVRYRVVCFVAEVISQLGELEYVPLLQYCAFVMSVVSEDMYSSLRLALMERVRDKEPFIRVQAVAALAKICGSEDLEGLGDDEQTATEVLENLLVHDPSACVPPRSHIHRSCSP
jgi:condensin complex subunit 3